MAQEFTYYEQPTWWFTREEIGRGLRERYQVPNELPPKLLALVRKLAAAESNQSPRSRRLYQQARRHRRQLLVTPCETG
jgi:hypothetical protein